MNAPQDTMPAVAAEAAATTPEAAVLITAKRQTRRGRQLKASTENPALAAAIAALVRACKIEEPLRAAHSAAEHAYDTARKDVTAPDGQVDAAQAAERRADRRWIKASGAVDKVARALLRIPVHTAADAELQQRAFDWCYDVRACRDIWGEEDMAACLAAARRALRRLTTAPAEPGSPPPPAAPPTADPTATAYIAVRRQSADYAHTGDVKDSHDVDDFPAADAMLAAAPVDVSGVAVRLGRILSEAFLHRSGDWDCPRCADKREAVTPPTSEELCGAGEGQNGGEDALFRALANLHLQTEKLAASYDHDKARAAFDWNTARDKALAAQANSDDSEGAFKLRCNTMEAWETLTPPSLEALAEVMRASLAFNGLEWGFSDIDCPRSMRDLLDSGDTPTIFAARFYMHTLRMTGSTSPALCTPPIAGLFPAFDSLAAPIDADGLQAAWKAHHQEADPYPSRVAEFGTWEAPEAAEVISDRGAIQARWHYSAAVHATAKALIDEYEARGGRFEAVRHADGSQWLGTGFARDGSPRTAEIEYLVAQNQRIRAEIGRLVRSRAADQGADAAQPDAAA